MDNHKRTWALPACPPFSLASVVYSHGWAGLAPFEWNKAAEQLSYVTRLQSGCVVDLRMQEDADGVRVSTDQALTDTERAEVAEQVTWMLNLGQDFSDFYALAREEPKLAQAEAQAQGRILRSPTLFEDTVKTILTTNTSWAGTIRMVRAVVNQYGTPLPTDPTRHAFPTADQLAVADEETLRRATGLGYRAPYVLELARAVAEGDLDLEALKTADLTTEELRRRLLTIKGVGGYAAANLLILLGHYDFLPVDSWALKMVSREWHAGAAVQPADVEAAFERWGRWKGLAYFFWDWEPH